MALIVALDEDGRHGCGPGEKRDFPVLSITPGIDEGYVMENIRYYIGDSNAVRREHQSVNRSTDFKIGTCRFIKEGEVWYFLHHLYHDRKYRIVYGADALEAYMTGDMFKHLYHLFPAD